jgi:NADH:ubiquinone oxidoreductase subunit H
MIYFIENYIYNFLSLSYFNFLLIFYLNVILSVWSRAAGPRVRLDQINKLTWKQYLPFLGLYFNIILCIILFV